MVDCMRTACACKLKGSEASGVRYGPSLAANTNWTPPARKCVCASELVNAQVGSAAHSIYSACFNLYHPVHMSVDVFVRLCIMYIERERESVRKRERELCNIYIYVYIHIYIYIYIYMFVDTLCSMRGIRHVYAGRPGGG